MSVDRRRFLELTSALGLTLACRPSRPVPATTTRVAPADAAFRHGVASGDPRHDGVILWTRVTPRERARARAVELAWVVAEDEALSRVRARGSAVAVPGRDFTAKVDVSGLAPGTTYFYAFETATARSPVGRTRTLPVDTARVRLAYTSCSNYPYGHFNVYAAMAARDDLDAVLHLGDYIYEYGDGVYGDGARLGRYPDPLHEAITLSDYRRRYARYREDPDLQELHRRHPMIAVWDDHELANNAWIGGAENHQPDPPEREGAWATRRAGAVQAYNEWMPIREQLPADRIYRAFRCGDLVDLLMLDTRLIGRDRQLERDDAGLRSPGRSLLGRGQEAWLATRLDRSRRAGVTWRVLGQQVLFGQLRQPDGASRNTDMWSGYEPARRRLLDHLAGAGVDNVVVLSGDIHSSWALELARDPFARDPALRAPLAVEFVTPAVSSPPPVALEQAEQTVADILARHPHIRWVDMRHRGYVLLELTRERARAEWRFVDGVDQRSSATRTGAVFEVAAGSARLRRDPPTSTSS